MVRAFTQEEAAAVNKVLGLFFTLRDDGWHNARADEELAIARKNIESWSANARLGGRPRREVGSAPRGSTDDAPETNLVSNSETQAQTNSQTNSETGAGTQGENPLAPHPPSTIHHPPSATPQPPPATQGQRRRGAVESAPTWAAYAEAYRRRYGVDPVRNARVNAQLRTFIQAVGLEDAPQVAAFFVSHNDAYYVRRGHVVGLLLSDAEKLRTEWATGRRVTGATARQEERASTTRDSFAQLVRVRATASRPDMSDLRVEVVDPREEVDAEARRAQEAAEDRRRAEMNRTLSLQVRRRRRGNAGE